MTNKERKNNIFIGWLWWIFLVIISLFNISYILNYYLSNNFNKDQNTVVILAVVYSIVCGLRGAFPKKDIEQICFFDSILSRPIFGRTIATVAELSYIKMISITLNKITSDLGLNFTIIDKLFYFILIAQTCSWMGCLTKNNLWNATEESIWMITFIIITFIITYIDANSVNLGSDKSNMINLLLKFALPFCILYVLGLLIVDIPMYLRRWRNSPDPPKNSMINNIKNFSKIKKVSKSYEVWEEDIPWQTAYFTIGVWSAIGLSIWYHKYSNL